MRQIDPTSDTSLVIQIVTGVTRLVEKQTLRPGMKMPSIRQFANSHRVRLFTVVEAYDRLVALGVLVSRQSAGFFVRRRSLSHSGENAASRSFQFDGTWYLRSIFESHALEMRPGCGWLPSSLLFNDGLQRGLRRLASSLKPTPSYGDPKGHAPLRRLVSQALINREIAASEDQVLLTQGSSQAMDLVAAPKWRSCWSRAASSAHLCKVSRRVSGRPAIARNPGLLPPPSPTSSRCPKSSSACRKPCSVNRRELTSFQVPFDERILGFVFGPGRRADFEFDASIREIWR